ncbi:hypothetical protein LXL04_011872 [Taraxacum kok-saghyz]
MWGSEVPGGECIRVQKRALEKKQALCFWVLIDNGGISEEEEAKLIGVGKRTTPTPHLLSQRRSHLCGCRCGKRHFLTQIGDEADEDSHKGREKRQTMQRCLPLPTRRQTTPKEENAPWARCSSKDDGVQGYTSAAFRSALARCTVSRLGIGKLGFKGKNGFTREEGEREKKERNSGSWSRAQAGVKKKDGDGRVRRARAEHGGDTAGARVQWLPICFGVTWTRQCFNNYRKLMIDLINKIMSELELPSSD